MCGYDVNDNTFFTADDFNTKGDTQIFARSVSGSSARQHGSFSSYEFRDKVSNNSPLIFSCPKFVADTEVYIVSHGRKHNSHRQDFGRKLVQD